MESYKVNRTNNTPHIYLDIEKRIFEIKGPSYSEDIADVYTPVIKWVEDVVLKLEGELICELYFDVLNSVAHKKIFQILILLSNHALEGKKIRVNWYFDDDDEDIQEMGEDLIDLINIPLKLIPVEA